MHMPFVQNVPFFSIMLCMVCGVASAMLSGKVAKWLTVALSAAVAALNLWLTMDLWFDHRSFTYMMGHFPAPWGTELRGGLVESTLAVCFSLIMLLCDILIAFVDPRIRSQYQTVKKKRS